MIRENLILMVFIYSVVSCLPGLAFARDPSSVADASEEWPPLVGHSLRKNAENNIQDISNNNKFAVEKGQILYVTAPKKDCGGEILVKGELVIDNYLKQQRYANAEINEYFKNPIGEPLTEPLTGLEKFLIPIKIASEYLSNSIQDPWNPLKRALSTDKEVFDVELDQFYKYMSQKASLTNKFDGSYYARKIIIGEQGVVKLTFGTYQEIKADVNGRGVLNISPNNQLYNIVNILGDIGGADLEDRKYKGADPKYKGADPKLKGQELKGQELQKLVLQKLGLPKLEKMIVGGGSSVGVGGSINVKKLYLQGGKIQNATHDDISTYEMYLNSPIRQFFATPLSLMGCDGIQSIYGSAYTVELASELLKTQTLQKALNTVEYLPLFVAFRSVQQIAQSVSLGLDVVDSLMYVYSHNYSRNLHADYFYQHTDSQITHDVEKVVFDVGYNAFEIFRQKITTNDDSIPYLTNGAFSKVPKIVINSNHPSTLYWLAHTDVAECQKFEIELKSDATIRFKPEIFVKHEYIAHPTEKLAAYSTLPYYGDKSRKHTVTLELLQPYIYQRSKLSPVGIAFNVGYLALDNASLAIAACCGPWGLFVREGIYYIGGIRSITSIHSVSDLVKGILGTDSRYQAKHFEFSAEEDVDANIVFNPNKSNRSMLHIQQLNKSVFDRGIHSFAESTKFFPEMLPCVNFAQNYNKKYENYSNSNENQDKVILNNGYEAKRDNNDIWKIYDLDGKVLTYKVKNSEIEIEIECKRYNRDGVIEFSQGNKVIAQATDPQIQIFSFVTKASRAVMPLMREMYALKYDNKSQGYDDFNKMTQGILGNIRDAIDNNYNGHEFDSNQMMIVKPGAQLRGSVSTLKNNYGIIEFKKDKKTTEIKRHIGDIDRSLSAVVLNNSTIIEKDLKIFAPLMIGPELKYNCDTEGKKPVLEQIQKNSNPLDISVTIGDGAHIGGVYNFNDQFNQISVGKNVRIDTLASCNPCDSPKPLTVENDIKIGYYARNINFKGNVEFLNPSQELEKRKDELFNNLECYISQKEYDKIIRNLIESTKDTQTWAQNIGSNYHDMIDLDNIRNIAHQNTKKGIENPIDVTEFYKMVMLHVLEAERYMLGVNDEFKKDMKSGYENHEPYHKTRIRKNISNGLWSKREGYTVEEGKKELEYQHRQNNLRYDKDVNEGNRHAKDTSITLRAPKTAFKGSNFDDTFLLCSDEVKLTDFADSKGSLKLDYGPLSPKGFLEQEKIYFTFWNDELLKLPKPDDNHMKEFTRIKIGGYTKFSTPQKYETYNVAVRHSKDKATVLLVVQTDTAGIEQVVGYYSVDPNSKILKDMEGLIDKIRPKSVSMLPDRSFIYTKTGIPNFKPVVVNSKVDVYKINGKISCIQKDFRQDIFNKNFRIDDSSSPYVDQLKTMILNDGLYSTLRSMSSDQNKYHNRFNKHVLYDHTAALNGSGNVIAAGEIGDVRINAYVDPFLQFEYDFDKSRIAKKIAGASMGLFANVDKQSMLGIAYDLSECQIEEHADTFSYKKMALFGSTTLDKIYLNVDISRDIGSYKQCDIFSELDKKNDVASQSKLIKTKEWGFMGKVGYNINLNKNSKLMPYVVLQHSNILVYGGGIRFDSAFLIEDGDTLIKPFISYQITGSSKENQANILRQYGIELLHSAKQIFFKQSGLIDRDIFHQLAVGYDMEERNGMISAAKITVYANNNMVGVRAECRIGYKF